ncbi:MAG: selenocysteine-specific translation elongation factor [Atopococcus tabaci]|uniref:Selenocysteine-specific elongation factor n=1 Tax=Atopococcus tabaci TaxID=269774 RepID=A0AA43UB04_9LACT|nr:selenocysteine-specific translation elongation factor [Atopococcus tabaci]
MQNFVIGTAGHIDHGKSTLIKALTGEDLDSTREEKERGLTINLGFTYLTLDNGEEIGIVDVPGHEKFVKNMLAGAAGIDAALLVIDANEGIMPQTQEHAAILTLLGIEKFIIVLTKTAQADETLLEIVKEDIRDQFSGTPLDNAVMVETDAVEGIGIDDLKSVIQTMAEDSDFSQKESVPARLNVDRAFSVKGIGTVVTGTLAEGVLEVGDTLTLYPEEIETTVRNIQIHGNDEPAAHAGNRTALNLTKLSLDDIHRGDVLTAGHLEASYMLDVKLEVIAEAEEPVKMWDRMHVNIGTKEVIGRVVPLGVEEIYPGDEGFAQLRLEEKVTVKKEDRFILRRFSPVITVAGGTVLDESPEKHKRFNEDVIESLAIKESGDLSAIIQDFITDGQQGQFTVKEISDGIHTSAAELEDVLQEMIVDGQLIAFRQHYMAAESFNSLKEDMKNILAEYHDQYKIRAGMPLEEFRSRFKQVQPRDVDAVLKRLTEDEEIKVEGQYIALADFEVKYTPEQKKIHSRLENEIKAAGMQPPFIDQIIEKGTLEAEIFYQMTGKELYQLNQSLVFHRDVFEEAKQKIIDYIEENDTISLGEARDLLDTSRKYIMPFLEHLDDIGITARQDDVRILKNRK